MQDLENELKPLFKWAGGKQDEFEAFKKYIPKNYNIYIEPFIGGGSTFFKINPPKAVINDIHSELIKFYENIQKGNNLEIYNFMKKSKNNELTYYKIRDKLKMLNDLDIAKRFYYLRKTCFRGMLRYNSNGKFNISFGRYKTINYENLKNNDYVKLFKNTKIYNTDYKLIFKKYNSSKNFMFLDPPYDSCFTDYGYGEFNKKNHEELAALFKKTKIKCLMIIGKTDYIMKLYKGYIADEYEKKYKFKLYDSRIGKSINAKHLIIKNF